MASQKQEYIKILIAPDKFKGSLTSAQAAQAIKKGIEGRFASPDNLHPQFRTVEIADGGDGSLDVLQGRLEGSCLHPVKVHDPLGRIADSNILLYPMGGRRCAFVEMAKISGLQMLSKGERNPLRTTTFGLGEAICAAVEQGAVSVTLSIGGSATNDGGAGMLQALGYRFLNSSGDEIAAPLCGGDLLEIASITPPRGVSGGIDAGILSGVELKVICDVTNPLLGEQGATAVYGPQKGADEDAQEVLERGLLNYASVVEGSLGADSAKRDLPGAGAAGGVGYAGLAVLGAELIPGWRFFADVTSLEESVEWADMVITGEGSVDSQSLSGKVVSGVLNLAAKHKKPAVIFCGVSKLSQTDLGGVKCYSIASLGLPPDICMSEAAPLLEQLAREKAFV